LTCQAWLRSGCLIRARRVNHGAGSGAEPRSRLSGICRTFLLDFRRTLHERLGNRCSQQSLEQAQRATVSVQSSILPWEMAVCEQKVRDLPSTACVLSLCQPEGQP
jgi:hypothetical protein